MKLSEKHFLQAQIRLVHIVSKEKSQRHVVNPRTKLFKSQFFFTPSFIQWIPDKSGYEMVWFFTEDWNESQVFKWFNI